MANITEIIEIFKNALYGKDVRQNMIDLANAVNNESTNALEIAEKASEEIKQSVQDVREVIVTANDTIDGTLATKEAAEEINSQNAELYERLKNTDVTSLQNLIVPINITGLTINIDDYNYANGYAQGKWKCTTTGGAGNISGLPSNKDAFLLNLESPRAASVTDFVQIQTIYYAYNKTEYQRWCTNGTWASWILISTSGMRELTGTTITATGDWDNYTISGSYIGQSLAHSPPATNGSHAGWYVQVSRYAGSWVSQVAADLNGKATYRRVKQNNSSTGVWDDWVLMLDINTAKTVLGIQSATTGDITLNVTIANLQSTIDSLPKIINHGVTINVAAGTISTEISIANFSGTGYLNINGYSSAALYTHNVANMVITRCTLAEMNITGFAATSTTGDVFKLSNNTGTIHLRFCDSVTTSAASGVVAQWNPGTVICTNCTISNKGDAVNAYASRIMANNCYGTANTRVFRSQWSGIMQETARGTITGTTIYSKANGGVIFDVSGVAQ